MRDRKVGFRSRDPFQRTANQNQVFRVPENSRPNQRRWQVQKEALEEREGHSSVGEHRFCMQKVSGSVSGIDK